MTHNDFSAKTSTHRKTSGSARSSETVPAGYGRLPIGKVSPVIEHGAYPSKAVLGELIPISARIFRDGHDSLGASVILTSPDGQTRIVDMEQIWPEGLDIWQAHVRLDQQGTWMFCIEAFGDDWHTWHHNADVKLANNMDIELIKLEAIDLFDAALPRTTHDPFARDVISDAKAAFESHSDPEYLREQALRDDLNTVMTTYGRRSLKTRSQSYPIKVDRQRALYGSWYEFFPRSQGAYQDENGAWVSGTFNSSHAMLERIADLGFDVAYVPPIHPIGYQFRKGKNNSLNAGLDQPGSPWAIGSPDGGHDAIHPDLGTIDDFDRFVAKAKSCGLEVALDFALQASPDHPWVQTNPEWFTTRLDGTIAYAENPPKKYQDIYPINFDNDPAGIYAEAKRIIDFWISHGITIFRVDNPHTKPINFWAWLIAAVNEEHPDVIFFSEAFSRPEVMHSLGKAGFHMSYTYFTWRNSKKELAEYLEEVSSETADFLRPNFFVNTPDINPAYVHGGQHAAFVIRIILAATMSPSWGIYSGFEFFEHVPYEPGREVYMNSEKYEYRPRDLDAEPNLNWLLKRVNQIRRDHPALQQLRGTTVLETTSDAIFAFAKYDQSDRVIVVVSTNPDEPVSGEVFVDTEALGLEPGALFGVHDELTGANYVWSERNYVALDPARPAHIFSVHAQ